jgi:hypothetical protein
MRNNDPLGEYVAKHGLTDAEAARRCGISLDTFRGYKGSRERRRRPGVDNALKIERGTKGEVPVEAWKASRKPKSK